MEATKTKKTCKPIAEHTAICLDCGERLVIHTDPAMVKGVARQHAQETFLDCGLRHRVRIIRIY